MLQRKTHCIYLHSTTTNLRKIKLLLKKQNSTQIQPRYSQPPLRLPASGEHFFFDTHQNTTLRRRRRCLSALISTSRLHTLARLFFFFCCPLISTCSSLTFSYHHHHHFCAVVFFLSFFPIYRSMRWKGKHKAGLSEGYCSELLEGALASRRFCLRRRQRSSRRMNRRRGSWYCHRSTSASHSKNQQQAGQQQQPWGGESFSHLGALVSGPITLFATYDVIRGGH